MRDKICFFLFFSCLISFGQQNGFYLASRQQAGGGLTLESDTDVINAADHKVEEQATIGTNTTGSEDLEFGYNANQDANVGLFFDGLNVPAGATITEAYIEFTGYATNTGTIIITIYGQEGANPSVFIGTPTAGHVFGLTDRPQTTASVEWNVPSWTIDVRNANTKTPDLSAIVQEIVDNPSYVQGHNMVFKFMDEDGGTVVRKAKYYTPESVAPKLTLSYEY